MDSMHETIKFIGIVKARSLPDCSHAEYMQWWTRLTEAERERYTVAESRNILTTAGRTQLLGYISASLAVTSGFGMFFSVGTFPINAVFPADSSVQGEIFRAVPSSNSITGNQLVLSTFIGSSQAIGIYTNAGLYGGAATATLGTGTLYTHTLFSYNKPSGTTLSCDYLISLI